MDEKLNNLSYSLNAAIKSLSSLLSEDAQLIITATKHYNVIKLSKIDDLYSVYNNYIIEAESKGLEQFIFYYEGSLYYAKYIYDISNWIEPTKINHL